MSITIHSIVYASKAKEGGKTYWVVSAYSADVTGLETVLAAATSPKNLFLESVFMQCPSMSAGETFNIQNDDDLFFQFLGDMGGGLIVDIAFENPIEFSGAIKVDQQAADPVNIIIKGFTA